MACLDEEGKVRGGGGAVSPFLEEGGVVRQCEEWLLAPGEVSVLGADAVESFCYKKHSSTKNTLSAGRRCRVAIPRGTWRCLGAQGVPACTTLITDY